MHLRIRLISVLLLVFASLLLNAQEAAKKPYSEDQIEQALKYLGPSDSADSLITQIASRGVDFQLTPEEQAEWRKRWNVSTGFLEALRNLYRRSPSPAPVEPDPPPSKEEPPGDLSKPGPLPPPSVNQFESGGLLVFYMPCQTSFNAAKAHPTIFVGKLKLAELPCGRFFQALAMPATFRICVNHDICQVVNVQARQSYFFRVARPHKYDILPVAGVKGLTELRSLSATPLEAHWVATPAVISTNLEQLPASAIEYSEEVPHQRRLPLPHPRLPLPLVGKH